MVKLNNNRVLDFEYSSVTIFILKLEYKAVFFICQKLHLNISYQFQNIEAKHYLWLMLHIHG